VLPHSVCHIGRKTNVEIAICQRQNVQVDIDRLWCAAPIDWLRTFFDFARKVAAGEVEELFCMFIRDRFSND
jgi:hypothetical protein